MICTRCLRRLTRAQRPHSSARLFTSLATHRNAVEPFTEPPSISSAGRVDVPPRGSARPDTLRIRSSVPAGTPLQGLNFLKDRHDPVAMEDHEYPEWLWEILEKRSAGSAARDGGQVALTKKQAKKAAKKQAKLEKLKGPPEVRIPIEEQTIDLPVVGETDQSLEEASAAIRELNKAMRAKRRAAIKEDNFLRTMK